MMSYNMRISAGAPISYNLALRFNQLEADISSAEPNDQLDVALNGMMNFMSALVQAVHQLETGKLPEVSFPDEDDPSSQSPG